MRISAFVLVCLRVMAELGLFLLALCFLIFAFATSISTLKHGIPDFAGIGLAGMSLLSICLGIFPAEKFYDIEESIWVMLVVCSFLVLVGAFLLNLLVAQLNRAYSELFLDMQGYARLNRADVIVSTMAKSGRKRWAQFLQSLRLDEKLEFNEGDIGLAGGISASEPASVHPTTVDTVIRYGGSTSTAQPWPEEELDEDKFARLEKLILRVARPKGTPRARKSYASNAPSQGASGAESSDGSSSSEEESDD
ncbi:unnamed protein product [Effrenium voratum]|uniref:Polycystin cation channel PKD1/PKD2 domain-containing protein n=1 Tax=Effrenium voratum TaxID=2562239 RepID=A0AA36MZK9_9DINO|nr:unnamed protein product [Effrenium voratum]